MYKLIAFDLDETLLGSDHHVPERNRRAIARAMEQGVYVVPCSGRSFNIMQEVLHELGMYQRKHTYSVSFNGACITENYHNRICALEDSLSWDDCNAIWQYGCELGTVDVHLYTLNTIWTTPLNAADQEVFDALHIPSVATTQRSIEFLKGSHLVKILYMNLSLDYLHTISKTMPPIAPALDTTFSSDRYLEFNAKGVSKASGLTRLAAYLGIDMHDVIAIGDSDNDAEMIRAAGLGVCMANGGDAYKRMANYVTRATNDEGGVAEVIEKFVL